jgi:hypothetical protein
VNLLNLLLAALLVGLALRTFLARRNQGGTRPLGDWLYIAAMLLMAVPLLAGRGLIFLSILGVLLLIAAQVWAGWASARRK